MSAENLKQHLTKAQLPDAALPHYHMDLSDELFSLPPYDPKTPLWGIPESLQKGIDSSCCMTFMPPAQRLFLWSFIYALAPKRYLEIGTAQGGSAMVVLNAIKSLGKDFDFRGVCVDPQFDFKPEVRDELASHFIFIEEFSSQTVMKKARSSVGSLFDVILVDGDHSYDSALTDMLLAMPFVKPGGYILVDDAGYYQVRDAVNYVLQHFNWIDVGLMSRHLTEFDKQHRTESSGSWRGEKPYMSGLYVLRKPKLHALKPV